MFFLRKNIIFGAFVTILFLFAFFTQSCKKETTKNSNVSHSIGDNYQGGVIFYIDATGNHGLVAAAQDQTLIAKWGQGTNTKTGADAINVGGGQQNTTSIVNILGTGTYAASICDQLELNGYSDWFLPSRNELNLLYQQRNAIGGFSEGYYWSSTEYSATQAWYVYFPYGPQFFESKDSLAAVRAIRAF